MSPDVSAELASWWRDKWPPLEALQRGHLRRVWLKPDQESEDPDLWPHEPYYLDPLQVLSVVELPRSTPWSTSIIRLRGLIIPVDVLGTPEQVFYLLGLEEKPTTLTQAWQMR
jgi:hypothetical protein